MTWRLENGLRIGGGESRQRLQKASGGCSVEYAMIECQAQGHHLLIGYAWRCGGVVERDGRTSLNSSEAEDRSFGEVNDWGESVDAQRTKIRDCERAPLQVLSCESPSASFLDQVTRLVGDLEDGLVKCVADDRNHQSLVCVDGDADVDFVEEFDGVVSPASVKGRVLMQSDRHKFGKGIGDRRYQRLAGAFELLAKIDHAGHVDVCCVGPIHWKLVRIPTRLSHFPTILEW